MKGQDSGTDSLPRNPRNHTNKEARAAARVLSRFQGPPYADALRLPVRHAPAGWAAQIFVPQASLLLADLLAHRPTACSRLA